MSLSSISCPKIENLLLTEFLLRSLKTMITKHLLLLGCLTVAGFTHAHEDCTDTLELNSRLTITEDTQVLKDEGFAVWGGSTIKGDDGKYHMFYARWPGAGLGGWQTKSTIAYAVSDSPYGPFKYVKTILQGSGDKSRWDFNNAHNPHIKKFGDSYYLYYIAARDWTVGTKSNGKPWTFYDTQSIGVLKFDSFDEILDDSYKANIPDEPCITADGVQTFNRNVNPSVTQGPDGRFYAAMKARGNADGGGGFIHWVMVAPTPEGPFKVHAKMLDHDLGAEDPYFWYDQKRERFYAIVKEFGSGKLAPEHGALALITSIDAKEWKKAKHPVVTLKKMKRADGKVYNLGFTDRPQLVFNEKGEIIALNVASSGFPEYKGVYNVQLKILPPGEGDHWQTSYVEKAVAARAAKQKGH